MSFLYQRVRAAVGIALVTFLIFGSSQSQRTPRRGLDPDRLSGIAVRLQSLVDEGAIVGTVALVAMPGRVLSVRAVGFEELETRKPMRSDMIFDVRSVTKVVTAIGIMTLVEEGKVALKDPVEKYLPEFKKAAGQTNGAPAAITIHHLLTHTSGLPFSRPAEIEDITIKRDRTLAEVVTLLAKQEPEFAPGTQFRYGSSGFAILGRVIEVVSGQAYDQFIKERVFDPLGMNDSFFFIPAEKRNRVAPIYRRQDGKLARWHEIEEYSKHAKYPAPEFGMYSTAIDLAALCEMMLNGGTFHGQRILSPMSVVAMTSNHTTNVKSAITQRPAYQGLGWGLSGDPLSDFPLKIGRAHV